MTHIIFDLKHNPDSDKEHPEFPARGYVRVKQILAPLGPLPISRSSFWAGVKAGKFPQPRKISSRVTVWRAEDIHALLAKIDSGDIGYSSGTTSRSTGFAESIILQKKSTSGGFKNA